MLIKIRRPQAICGETVTDSKLEKEPITLQLTGSVMSNCG
jgi:hypothetical protein